MIGSKHCEKGASFHRVILAVPGSGIGVVKVTRPQRAVADVQISGQDIKVLRAHIHVRGVAYARLQSPKQNRITALPLDGEQFDPRAWHRELLPANRLVRAEEAEAGQAADSDLWKSRGR